MAEFRATGEMTVDEAERTLLGGRWAAARLDDDETMVVMKDVYERTGVVLDPHTAVGVGAARECGRGDVPLVCLATAHPAKFPDAVEAAIGVRPELPPGLADLFELPERYDVLPADLDEVRGHIEATLG
jgi:threonine synthase